MLYPGLCPQSCWHLHLTVKIANKARVFASCCLVDLTESNQHGFKERAVCVETEILVRTS